MFRSSAVLVAVVQEADTTDPKEDTLTVVQWKVFVLLYGTNY